MSADVDLDFGQRDKILNIIKHIPARREVNKKANKHISGVYVQPIPIDPGLHIASLHFKDADERGYFKLDFLNVSIYNQIKSPEHYEELLAMDPPWHRLAEPDFVKEIIHISNYSEQIAELMPDSIPRMAMFLAAIRPAKRHLLKVSWAEMAKTIWDKPDDDEYYFKKAHSISYAFLVALHMNLLNK